MEKIILTIDDCPSKDFKDLLDYLIKNRYKAVLFCVGKDLENEKNKKLIIKSIKHGFLIGNHSYSHPNFRYLSLLKSKEEISKTDKLIENLYKRANIDRPLKIFRFTHYFEGGLKKWKLQRFLKDLGYKNPYYSRKFFQRIVCQKRHFFYHLFQRMNNGDLNLSHNNLKTLITLLCRKCQKKNQDFHLDNLKIKGFFQ